MPSEHEEELDDENEDDEDEEEGDDEDEDEEEEITKEGMLEEIADALGDTLPQAVETEVDLDAGHVIISMNDESRWKLTLKKVG